jgi:hypothetical protein
VLYASLLHGRDGEGHTSLWCAVREQKYDMVNYLISRGAKVSHYTDKKQKKIVLFF